MAGILIRRENRDTDTQGKCHMTMVAQTAEANLGRQGRKGLRAKGFRAAGFWKELRPPSRAGGKRVNSWEETSWSPDCFYFLNKE